MKIWQSKDIDPEMYTVHFTAPDKDNITIIYVDIYIYICLNPPYTTTQPLHKVSVQHVLGPKIAGFG